MQRMTRSVALRISAVLGVFDVLFAAIASLAYLELVDARGAERTQVALLCAALHAIKLACWNGWLFARLRPVDRYLGGAPSRDLRRACTSVFGFPPAFATFFALLWAFVFVVLTAIGAGGEPRLPGPRQELAGLGLALATFLAAFPFVLLWAEVLAGPARDRLSQEAWRARIVLPPSRFGLRLRVGVLALCLSFAPTAWLVSMSWGARAPGTAVLASFVGAVLLWAPISAWLLLRTVATPIAQAARAIQEITKHGELADVPRLAVLDRDELGALAEGTNEMVERLTAELRRRAELVRENERLLAEARDAVAAREQFIAVASHELNTPLAAMAMAVQRLRDPRGVGLERATGALDRQVQRLVRLVRDLLDLSRLRSGKLEVNLAPVELEPLVRNLVADLRPAAERAGSELVVIVERGGTVVADTARVEQIVGNLISNALKFGQGKPVEVRLQAGGGAARVSVTDHGVGIAAEDQERIFERFEQGEGGRHHPGLGLGLYLSRELARAQRGSIELRSAPGEGSTFTLVLPS
jgi:signal transduction histidine kinase